MSMRIVRVRDLPGFHNPFKCDVRRALTAEGRELEIERGRQLVERVEGPVPLVSRFPWEHRCPTRRDVAEVTSARAGRVSAYMDRLLEAHAREYHSLPTCLLGIEGLMTEAEAIASIAKARQALADADQPPSCRYHLCDGRPIDWRLIADLACDVVERCAASQVDSAVNAAMGDLDNETDKDFLWSLFSDPIVWREGASRLTNGQHRVCGLALAGADRVPVEE